MSNITLLSKFFLLAIAAALALSGCNLPRSSQATPDATQVYQTVEARLTDSAALTPAPTATQAPSDTPPPSATPGLSTPTATQRSVSIPPTTIVKQCDMAAPGVPIDVTIPDGARLTPGQAFTKTWRLVNSGTCTWTKDYSLALFSGDPMGAGAGIQLKNDVAPGQSIDISADLVAPSSGGTYRGNWKLRNAQGAWFGIGPGGASPFWVEIVVAGTPGVPTSTSTAPTPYPGQETVVPGGAVSGNASLVPDDRINLDSGSINAASSDLVFKINAQDKLMLSPQSGALFAVMDFNQPAQATCATAALSANPITVTNLNSGQFVCYKTDKGRVGWMQMVSLNETTNTLVFQYYTWLNP